MIHGIRLEQKLSQQLTMTPQLQQAIKLVQLARAELQEAVQEALLENPLLEEASLLDATESATLNDKQEKALERAETTSEATGEAEPGDHEAEQMDWEAYFENYTAPIPGTGQQRLNDHDLPGVEATFSRTDSLFDHLIWQIQVSHFSANEQQVATAIVGNLDEDGYLKEITVEQLAEELDYSLEYVEEVLELVQALDPIGVAARDLRECLLLQARFYELDATVVGILDEHLDKLERKNYTGIARAMEIEPEAVHNAARRISRLEPRPGRPFAGEMTRYITPDVYIRKTEDGYQAQYNEDGMPKLRISKYYQEILRKHGEAESKSYLNERYNAAQFMIRSLRQRQETILKVCESIIKFQEDFFEKGEDHLKPLILKDVAEEIEMHESTVSRATANKYVHTPRGIYALKFFFNSSIQGVGGQDDLASAAVKSKLRALIDAENKLKPLSDQALVAALEKDGIKIARRTVAKYREAMGILSSTRRKEHF